MKKSLLILPLAAFALACPGQLQAAPPAKAPAGATPVEWSKRMADSEMAREGDKLCAEPTGKQKWNYTTGLYADALIRLSGFTHDKVYAANAEKIIGSFIAPDGKIATYEIKGVTPIASTSDTETTSGTQETSKAADAGKTTTPPISPYFSLDNIQSGVATLALYDLTGDERYHKAADFMRGQLKEHPRTKEGGFWHKERYEHQMWLDGLYMGEPFYAGYAKRFNEPADFDDIANQFRFITAHTYDPATGLLYHAWDESHSMPWANPQTGLSPSFWSRAIGWYAMALVDVLDSMPKDHPGRPALLEDLKKVTAGILKYQDPKTGVWWQVTDKGGQPDNYLEASASCMFVYTMAKGVNHGYLPKSDLPAIRAGYQGVLTQFVTFEPDGKTVNLTQCCKVAGLDKKRLGTYAYYTKGEKIVPNDLKGVGPFINLGVECSKLFGNETFAP